MLNMLDMQTDKLGDMATRVAEIDQIIVIHKEKVARREIGQLTTNKTVRAQHKIVQPSAEETEPTRRYVRQPIDYSILDDIGHGVRVQPTQMHMQSRFHTIGPSHASAQQLMRTESANSGQQRGGGSLGAAHGQRVATVRIEV